MSNLLSYAEDDLNEGEEYMNERIKELAVQAGVSSLWMSGTDQQGNPILEKFARLIVKECMQVLDPGEHQLIARFQARKMLEEHFGVE